MQAKVIRQKGDNLKVEEVIERAAKLCKESGAKKVFLFGSRAKGTALERSDIDIAER